MDIVEQQHEALMFAYLILLQIPYDSRLRCMAQKPMALCRDAIAAKTGQDPERVQNDYEAEARHLEAT